MLFLHSLNSLNILLLFNIKAFPLREFLFLFVVAGIHNGFSKSKCKSDYLEITLPSGDSINHHKMGVTGRGLSNLGWLDHPSHPESDATDNRT